MPRLWSGRLQIRQPLPVCTSQREVEDASREDGREGHFCPAGAHDGRSDGTVVAHPSAMPPGQLSNKRLTRLCSSCRRPLNLAVSLRLHQHTFRMCTVPNPDMQPAREVQVPPLHRTWDAISERIQPRGSVTGRFPSSWRRATQLVMLGSQGQEEQSRQWRIETTRPLGIGEQAKSLGICRPHVHAVVWPKHQVTDLRRRDAERHPGILPIGIRLIMLMGGQLSRMAKSDRHAQGSREPIGNRSSP